MLPPLLTRGRCEQMSPRNLEINYSGSQGQQRAISVKLGIEHDDASLHGQRMSRLHVNKLSQCKLRACLMPL